MMKWCILLLGVACVQAAPLHTLRSRTHSPALLEVHAGVEATFEKPAVSTVLATQFPAEFPSIIPVADTKKMVICGKQIAVTFDVSISNPAVDSATQSSVCSLPEGQYTWLVRQDDDGPHILYGKATSQFEWATRHVQLANGKKSYGGGEIVIPKKKGSVTAIKWNVLSGGTTLKIKSSIPSKATEYETNLKEAMTAVFAAEALDAACTGAGATFTFDDSTLITQSPPTSADWKSLCAGISEALQDKLIRTKDDTGAYKSVCSTISTWNGASTIEANCAAATPFQTASRYVEVDEDMLRDEVVNVAAPSVAVPEAAAYAVGNKCHGKTPGFNDDKALFCPPSALVGKFVGQYNARLVAQYDAAALDLLKFEPGQPVISKTVVDSKIAKLSENLADNMKNGVKVRAVRCCLGGVNEDKADAIIDNHHTFAAAINLGLPIIPDWAGSVKTRYRNSWASGDTKLLEGSRDSIELFNQAMGLLPPSGARATPRVAPSACNSNADCTKGRMNTCCGELGCKSRDWAEIKTTVKGAATTSWRPDCAPFQAA